MLLKKKLYLVPFFAICHQWLKMRKKDESAQSNKVEQVNNYFIAAYGKRGGIQPSVELKYIGDSRERYVRIIETSTKLQKMKGTPALKLAEVHVQRILLFGITRIQVAFFHRLTIKVY